jgi:hypothetical protein
MFIILFYISLSQFSMHDFLYLCIRYDSLQLFITQSAFLIFCILTHSYIYIYIYIYTHIYVYLF